MFKIMDAGIIGRQLHQYFMNYEYKLHNTFVFDWESDFFAMSKSGYFIEAEIKISRGDFFRDFEKDKHKLFQDLKAGKTFSCYFNGASSYDGDILLRSYREPEIWLPGFGGAVNYSRTRNGGIDTMEPLVEYNWHNSQGPKHTQKRYVVNDWGNRLTIKKGYPKDLHAPATCIGFHDLTKRNLPNQFYYAFPAGLIKDEEIPAYAGILHVRTYAGGREDIKMVRKAPYLHKRKMDLSRQLLQKYYNLWRFRVNMDEQIAIQKQQTA